MVEPVTGEKEPEPLLIYLPGVERKLLESPLMELEKAGHLRERFPQPYTLKNAEAWIEFTAKESPTLNFAICVEGHVVGGIGLMPGSDIHRVSAEVGYWLGEAFWGRSIAAAALIDLTRYAFATLADLNRLFAYVDEEHVASIRVLEKAHFRREGHLIGAALKQGQIRNQFLYALTRAEVQ